MSISIEDVKKLKREFSDSSLGVKIQSTSKDKSRAMLVLYLQHTDVADRLEEVDPAWSFQVLEYWTASNICYAKARLTLKGVTRENVGEGDEPKSAASDALKRCAMLFGVGRYLYDSDLVWVAYDENRDRFRQWTIADYRSAQQKTKSEHPQSSQRPSSTLSPGGFTAGLAPECCGGKMQISKFNPNEFYCPRCKAKAPVRAA